MIRKLIILLTAIVIQLSYGSIIDTQYQLKHSSHMFILRKCIASAQLNKKHRNEDIPNMNLNKTSEHSLGILNNSSMPKKNSNSHAKHLMPVLLNSKLNNNDSYSRYEMRNNDTSIN